MVGVVVGQHDVLFYGLACFETLGPRTRGFEGTSISLGQDAPTEQFW